MKPVTINVQDAVRASGLSRVTLWRLMASGQLDSIKVGARRLIKVDSLEALLSNGRERVPSDPLREAA